MTAKETQDFDDAHNIHSDSLNTPICQYNVSKAYAIIFVTIFLNTIIRQTTEATY